MRKDRFALVCVCLGLATSACLPASTRKRDAAVVGGSDGGGTGGSVDAAVDTSMGGAGGADAAAPDRSPPDFGPPTPAANVQFNTLYDTVIKVRCSPCHVTMDPRAGGLDMGDATTALSSLSMGTTGCATAMPPNRVVPGKPDDSYVIKKLTGASGICGQRMPKGCVDPPDGGSEDAVTAQPDAAPDTGADADPPDAGRDGKLDGRADARDAAEPDASPDSGPPLACLSPDNFNAVKSWIQTGAKVGRVLVNDGSNAVNWSLQGNFQIGMMGVRPWTDYPNTYVVSVDPPLAGLIGKAWVKVMAASKNYVGGPQAVITLTAPADVYIVVDDRWGTPPAFVEGWTDTGANFAIFENAQRPSLPFSLYKKSVAAGDLPLPPIGSNRAYDFFVIVD
jgi:hypothetical protein